MIPFSAEVIFALFEHYNRAIWPAQIVAYVLGLAVLALVARPVAGAGRIIAAILAAAWAWNGVAYHIMYFATINVAAPIFGWVFVAQAALLAWTGVLRGALAFGFARDAAGWTGLGLAVFAMAVYPALGWLAGHGWPQAAMFGVAPGPTTIFTIGLLLLVRGRTPLYLLVIPLLWSLVGGSAAWFLAVPEDLSLLAAGLAGLALALWQNRRGPAARASE